MSRFCHVVSLTLTLMEALRCRRSSLLDKYTSYIHHSRVCGSFQAISLNLRQNILNQCDSVQSSFCTRDILCCIPLLPSSNLKISTLATDLHIQRSFQQHFSPRYIFLHPVRAKNININKKSKNIILPFPTSDFLPQIFSKIYKFLRTFLQMCIKKNVAQN